MEAHPGGSNCGSIVLQWSNIVAAAQKVHGLLGWGGLALILIAVCTVIFQIGRRRLSSFILRWNRWLGSVAFLLAIWGILGFLKQGGDFGLGIISYPAPDTVGILSILGLVIIGVVMVAPGAFFRLLGGFASLLGGLFKRQPIPKYLQKQLQETPPPTTRPGAAVGEKPALPAEMEEPVVAPERAIPKSPLVAPQRAVAAEAAPAQPRQELRQVAQEVWKKYGQSSDLVVVDGWKLPPIEILDVTPEIEFGEADNLQRAEIIEQALASYGVEAKVAQINAGPAVTQFGLEPGWDRKFKEIKEKDRDGSVRVRLEEVSKTRVKVERITSLANDLALALAAPSIRIEAPVPGKSVVGIEVPNTNLSLVSLRGVIETGSFQKIEARSRLALALGKGAGGESVAGDLSRMPHLLIAGATGSGKTVCLNSSICCLLMNAPPSEVQFIMIDPKRVELTTFNSLPHLIAPVVVDTDKAIMALRWLNKEMDNRYQRFAQAGVRNIDSYNKNRQPGEIMPYIVLVIDELADLMMTSFDEVEHMLCRLAQLARATGIHLIVATQRPSVDVVTGLIKANFPTRISFALASQVDSRTILDSTGAEKLLGRGDMLYMPTDASKPKRLQGCFVSDAETERLVYFWGSQQRPEVTPVRFEDMSQPIWGGKGAEDSLLDAARELAQEYSRISTSFLQRRLRIGYPRAARIMEKLEEEGYKRGTRETTE